MMASSTVSVPLFPFDDEFIVTNESIEQDVFSKGAFSFFMNLGS